MPQSRRELLETAAVLGEHCSEGELRQLLAMTGGPVGEELDDFLAELHVDGWLPLGEPGQRRFSHARVREYVYRNIPGGRLGPLHRAAAEITAEDECYGRVIEAMHRLRAGEDRLDVLRAAADEAVAAFDDRKSASLLKAALRSAEQAGEDGLEDRVTITSRLAYAFCYAKQPDLAFERLEQLDRHIKKVSPQVAAEWKRARGFTLSRLGQHDEAAREYAQLAGAAIALGDPEILLQAHADHARSLVGAGDKKRARAELEQGLDMATMGEGPRADLSFPLWRYLLGIATVCEEIGEQRASLQYCRHAVWRAERSNNSLALMRAHTALARAFSRSGQSTRGEKHRTRAIGLSREFGDRKTSAELLLERAEYKLSIPRFDEAKACAETALALALVLEWSQGVRDARELIRRSKLSPTLS